MRLGDLSAAADAAREWIYARRALVAAELQALVRIPSMNPPGDERAAADRILALARSLGLDPVASDAAPGRPNVQLEVSFTRPGPTVVLTTHSDVVPAPPGQFGAEYRDGRIWGRGACDAKGSLVAMLFACARARELRDRGRGRVVFAAVVDEECAGIGTKALLCGGLDADAVVVGEPTNLTVAIGHRGAYWRRLTFVGRAAHASDPDAGVNAIYGAARFALAVRALDAELARRAPDPLFGPPRVSANQIHGGVLANVIADRCELVLDRRLVPGESLATADGEIAALAETLVTAEPGVHVRIEDDVRGVPPAATPTDHPVVVAGRAALQALGRPGEPIGFPGGTDLAYFVSRGMPGIVLGPGDLADAHTDGESVAVADVCLASAAYVLTVLQLCEVAP